MTFALTYFLLFAHSMVLPFVIKFLFLSHPRTDKTVKLIQNIFWNKVWNNNIAARCSPQLGNLYVRKRGKSVETLICWYCQFNCWNFYQCPMQFFQCPMQFFQCLMQMQLCYAINSETKACFISLIHSCVILDEVKLYDKDICF